MLAIKSNQQIEQEDKANQARFAPIEVASPAVRAEAGLVAHVKSCWESAKSHRNMTGLDVRLADCLRRFQGEYDPTHLAHIRDVGGSDIFMQITGSKCQAAMAWLSDLFFPAGEKAFSLDPTPIPDLDPSIKQKMIAEAIHVMQQSAVPLDEVKQMLEKHKDRLLAEQKQEAKDRMDRMADVIEDRLTESGFREELMDFLGDFTVYPFSVWKSLEFVSQKTMKWEQTADGGFAPAVGRTVLPKGRRVSPWRFYPSPSALHKLDGHWAIEHREFTRTDLVDMAKTEGQGYIAENIAQALLQYGAGGLKEWMFNGNERQILTGQTWDHNTTTIDAIEWEGSISGQKLLEAGLPKDMIGSPLEEHVVSLLVIGGYLIRVQFNQDPLGTSSYHVSQWQKIPGSLIGKALPEMIADQQDQCNAAARSLANNMAMSSGPMVWVDLANLATGENATDLYPWRIFQGNTDRSASQGSRPPIEFFQAQSHANELMGIFERFSNYADDISGIPKYASGSDSGAGAAKTASGLGMLMNNVGKSTKDRVRRIEINVIEPHITKHYNYEMLTNPDPEIKGDATPKARGSDQLMQKEQQAIRQRELLQATTNPVDGQIIGLDGRLEQLRKVFSSAEVDSTDILPTREEFAQRMAAMQQGMPQGEPNAPAAQ